MTNDFNLIVSSWPSAGGTTTALILANFFELKYIYAGGVLKHWAKKMGYDPKSSDFHSWESKYGEAWDYFWEDYIQKMLAGKTGYLSEGKTTGFLLPQSSAYSVMITATATERAARSKLDTRTENIHSRDELLKERWLKLFDINIFSVPKIQHHYDLKLDTTYISIAESVKTISDNVIEFYNLEDDPRKLEKIIENYLEHEKAGSGKDYLRDGLSAMDLYLGPNYVFEDWKYNFKRELSELPIPMQKAVYES